MKHTILKTGKRTGTEAKYETGLTKKGRESGVFIPAKLRISLEYELRKWQQRGEL